MEQNASKLPATPPCKNKEWRIVLLIALALCNACFGQPQKIVKVTSSPSVFSETTSKLTCGDERLDMLIPLIRNKNIALMVNQTSMVGKTHLIDTLLANGIQIRKIFAPEHGFRGTTGAGEQVNDSVDPKTGIPVVSLYGKKIKPSAADLKDVDLVIFDIQDVGARFYTFISSLHYLLIACAENDKRLIVLDRPNPNGWYIDGPVLKKEFSSFVGVDPIPVVHGLTVGEYAKMANGEHWIGDKNCDLQVITCLNYTHRMHYSLPVRPSPNLPNDHAIALYPSLCFFEGTEVSVGRGTDSPFEVIGSPFTDIEGAYVFIPRATAASANPPFLNRKCFGYDLRNETVDGFSFKFVLEMYQLFADKSAFFLKNNFFDKLCGTDEIRKMIEAGKNEEHIKASYQKELDEYKAMRKKYLLYTDYTD